MKGRSMRHIWIMGALLLGTLSPLAAQQSARLDTREDLAARRDSLTDVLTLLDSEDERAGDVQRRIATIEQRLRVGDFRPGDMVSLEVRGREEYTGNFPVQPDQTLELPGLDPISLSGVLYSEATGVIRDGLAVVLRNPVVDLTFQMRLAVTGQVSDPGFYDVRGSLLVSDVISLAGGPTQSADLERIEIRRDGEKLMSGKRLATQAFTLDDLGLRSGDVIQVPREQDTFHAVRTVSIIIGSLLSVIALIRIF